MDDRRFDTFAQSFTAGRSRRGLGRLLGGLALAAPHGLAGPTEAAAKKKRKKKTKCRPARDDAVVASFCFRGDAVGSTRAYELGQQFFAWRQGRLDRVDVMARSGPGGQHVFEIRDLNQGRRHFHRPCDRRGDGDAAGHCPRQRAAGDRPLRHGRAPRRRRPVRPRRPLPRQRRQQLLPTGLRVGLLRPGNAAPQVERGDDIHGRPWLEARTHRLCRALMAPAISGRPDDVVTVRDIRLDAFRKGCSASPQARILCIAL